MNSTDAKYAAINGSTHQQQIPQRQHLQINNQTNNNNEDDEFAVVSSSTVDPVPINNKGLGGRSESNRNKTSNHSPRQGMTSGSLPSVHKQSGNSDLMRTSFGGNNRSSPSHNLSRHNPFRHLFINPCNPSDNQNLFTSHLRRWQHALPKTVKLDGPVVHWKSLTTPACLPLTTDYFPSNEELARRYTHYMYTVSASEDTNLYQAGDRSLSEHKKTENLLIEMLSQRLAQGFQIIVDNTSSSNYTKPKGDGNKDAVVGGITAAAAAAAAASGKDIDHNNTTMVRSGGSPSGGNHNNNATTTLATTMTIGGNTKLTSTGANTVPVVSKGVQDENEKSKWKHMVWWLSMGHQVHQLTFDSSGQNVEVRRYVRRIQFDVDKINYKCTIWPKNMETYRPKTVMFNYPSLLYAWNYLDHLVAGYQEELTDNLRFWRARFIVIPRETLPTNITLTGALHEHLDEEEKRLALFESWIQNIRKAKWLTPEEREELQKRRKKEIGFSDLGIKLTTMDPSAYVASDVMRAAMTVSRAHNSSNLLSSIIISQGLTRDSRSKDIANALQDPKGGVKIMDRRWHFRMFRDVFTGTEFVDWIIGQIEDITTREQAVQFGNSLMQRKPPLFHSATKRHSFLDGNYFYTLHEEFAHKKSAKVHRKAFGHNNNNNNNNSNSESATNSASTTPSKEKELSHDNMLRQVPSTHSSVSTKRVEFQMSQSMIIDVDPYKKSDRRETAILHYDTIHNPNNCYHFQLNWLGCTAQLVQELLQNWSRQAERCGLKLVEGSVDQAYEDSENDNPFQCPVPIPMAVPPPSVDELVMMSKIDVPAQFYEIALVRHLEFVLDVEADFNFDRAKTEGVDLEYSYIKEVYKYDQYVHRSGVSFVQIRPEKQGFYWVNNRLYTNHTPALIANRRQPTSVLCHPDALRTKFQEHCSNVKWLTGFWERTRANFLEGLDPDSSDAWVFENSGAIVEVDTNVTEDTNETNEKGPNGNTSIDIPPSNHGTQTNVTVTISAASPSKNDAISIHSPALSD
jgi:hypothetical protein